MRFRILAVLTASLMLAASCFVMAHADNLDEIEKYVVTADVRDDATVDLTYHFEWRVLDSDLEGPLEWVKIGIPNSYADDCEALSDNIRSIELEASDGNYAVIYFDRSYEAGEVVNFDFRLHADYLYQINRDNEGETVYSFTPGWFDEIAVDELVIRWNADKALSWDPDCLVKDGYCTFTTALEEGDIFTVDMTYPNDAYAFDQEVSDGYDEYNSYDYYDGYDESEYDGIMLLLYFGAFMLSLLIQFIAARFLFRKGGGFGTEKEKKVTRTRVEYYTNCPNCGAPRGDGATKDKCEYCGTNLVKSEVVLKEEDLTDEEKAELKKFKKDGEYQYLNPNTFVRVHTAYIPVSHSGGHRGGSGCACACASCACACACACAGGGRAGCSNKDFYKGIDVERINNK